MSDNERYEAKEWEVVPVRSIKSAQAGKRSPEPAIDPLKAIDEGLRQVFPAEARVHFHTARRELLLAFKSMVDAALERVERDVQKERSKIDEPKNSL